jgi:hypothetical protein
MLHKYKSDEPEYDFNYEVEILVHRLERAGLKETFEVFMGLVLDQFIIRFGIGQIILDTEEREIYHWLEDPVNFYVNRYDDYFELLNAYAKHDNEKITEIVDKIYNSGVNFTRWFEEFHS